MAHPKPNTLITNVQRLTTLTYTDTPKCTYAVNPHKPTKTNQKSFRINHDPS